MKLSQNAKENWSMIRTFEDKFQYESFTACVMELKARYRRTHPGETEGLHYQFNERCVADGRSGFLKVVRLEAPITGPAPRTETVLIEDNRVVAHQIEELSPEGVELWRWLE
jgi:hypothetical protein